MWRCATNCRNCRARGAAGSGIGFYLDAARGIERSRGKEGCHEQNGSCNVTGRPGNPAGISGKRRIQPDWKRSNHDGSCGAGCPSADQTDETKG